MEGWPDTEDTGRRLSDDCWAGPHGLAKKEESAVQQRRRKVPPFSDVSPATCGSRRTVAKGCPENGVFSGMKGSLGWGFIPDNRGFSG